MFDLSVLSVFDCYRCVRRDSVTKSPSCAVAVCVFVIATNQMRTPLYDCYVFYGANVMAWCSRLGLLQSTTALYYASTRWLHACALVDRVAG